MKDQHGQQHQQLLPQQQLQQEDSPSYSLRRLSVSERPLPFDPPKIILSATNSYESLWEKKATILSLGQKEESASTDVAKATAILTCGERGEDASTDVAAATAILTDVTDMTLVETSFDLTNLTDLTLVETSTEIAAATAILKFGEREESTLTDIAAEAEKKEQLEQLQPNANLIEADVADKVIETEVAGEEIEAEVAGEEINAEDLEIRGYPYRKPEVVKEASKSETSESDLSSDGVKMASNLMINGNANNATEGDAAAAAAASAAKLEESSTSEWEDEEFDFLQRSGSVIDL